MYCEEVGDEFVCVRAVISFNSDPNVGAGADVSVGEIAGSGNDDDDGIDDDESCFDLVEVVLVVVEEYVVKQ